MPGTTSSDPSSGWGCSGHDSSLGKRSREEDGEPGVTITGDEPSLPYLPVASPATTDPFPQQDSAPAHLLGLASHGAAAAVRCEDGRQCHSSGRTAAGWSQAAAVAAFTSYAALAAASDVAAAPAAPCGGQGSGSDGHGTAPGEAQPMLSPQAPPPPQSCAYDQGSGRASPPHGRTCCRHARHSRTKWAGGHRLRPRLRRRHSRRRLVAPSSPWD